MDTCSPVAEGNYRRHGTCYDERALQQLASAWNASGRGRQIEGVAAKGVPALRRELRARLSSVCAKRAGSADACWAEALGASRDGSVAKALRPKRPAAWDAKPNAWLSNYDIAAVMRQYAATPEFRFEFLGVVPVDFAEPTAVAGNCYEPQLCQLRLATLADAGKAVAGLIINLDRHDEPGSHWTSLLAVLDPALPSYGAYYYDSTGAAWPAPVRRYMQQWQAQMRARNPRADFPLRHSRARHQYGMFAMFHQILWLERLRQDRERRRRSARRLPSAEARRLEEDAAPTTFKLILSLPIRDDHVHRLRDVLYRAQNLKP
jgi:hypothetical protein